ncbi:MAG: hypothetical protein K2W92_08670 [Alphaproteobacteria bacterium]|nr:hypothetical protein [Alphaproteobacteria bacterium]
MKKYLILSTFVSLCVSSHVFAASTLTFSPDSTPTLKVSVGVNGKDDSTIGTLSQNNPNFVMTPFLSTYSFSVIANGSICATVYKPIEDNTQYKVIATNDGKCDIRIEEVGA